MKRFEELSVRKKIYQTIILRIEGDHFDPAPVGAAFFFGEIATDASSMGLAHARHVLQQYADNADIPILLASDFENGCGSMLSGLTPLPYLMNLGAANDLQLAYDYGKATALDARSIGANWSFSPVCDLNLNPRNPLVNIRALTDDVSLACRLLPEVVRGMQENGLAACAKHFPGDGCDYRDQHLVTTCNTLSFADWQKQHGRVFKALMDAGVLSIMAGHISLPAWQQERVGRLAPPATLSQECITGLLKGRMGFDGVVITDALNMGGFGGWYDTAEEAEVAAFAAGCDMLLWPSDGYAQALEEAIRDGRVPMQRLDDAVRRILRMKEKLGLFDKPQNAKSMTKAEHAFVQHTQRQVAEKSITLVRDTAHFFPISPARFPRVAVVPITHHAPALTLGEQLCDALRRHGFAVSFFPNGIDAQGEDGHDLILYALFSRPFRPMGFLDFHSSEAGKIQRSLQRAVRKTMVVSFGSPYFVEQYFERALCCVNAYSMLPCSVEAFVRAATGEIPFTHFSPVRLKEEDASHESSD